MNNENYDERLQDPRTIVNVDEEAVMDYLFLSLPSQTQTFLEDYWTPPNDHLYLLHQDDDLPDVISGSLVDPQFFPFEIAKILPPGSAGGRIELHLPILPLSASASFFPTTTTSYVDDNIHNYNHNNHHHNSNNFNTLDPVCHHLELTPSDDSSVSHSNFPFTHYQPHLKKQKRVPVYEKNLSFFSISHQENAQYTDINGNNNPPLEEANQKTVVVNHPHLEDTILETGPGSMGNIKEKESEVQVNNHHPPEEPVTHNTPQPRELVFEFTDSFLQNRVLGDINPCSKKDRGLNRKIHWKKMTPELFQEIYVWEKKQLALQNKVKQYQIQTKFNVNRSTYYRWKKKYERSLSSSGQPPTN